MDRCASCGAGLAAGAAWCGLCFAPVGGPPAFSSTLPTEEETGPFWPAGPPDGPAPVYSRWRGGATSFGPVGRIAITLLVCVAPILLALRLRFYGLFMLAVWLVIVCPVVLRQTWKRDRVE